MNLSLAMDVEEIDGAYWIAAPWLDEPVSGATWQEAYDKAVRARHSSGHGDHVP